MDPSFRSPGFELAHNAAAGRTRINSGGRRLSSILEHTVGPSRTQALGARLPTAVKAVFKSEVELPVLPDPLRKELERELRGEVEQLRAHTGLAFAGWSV